MQIETDAWFLDSFEEWRKAKNLNNFILLGHSLGGYVAAKYALQVTREATPPMPMIVLKPMSYFSTLSTCNT